MPLKSYGQWLYEQTQAGLPTNVRPPITVEPYAVWFKRMRGLSTDGTRVLESKKPSALVDATPAAEPNVPVAGATQNSFRRLAARFFG